MGAFASQIMGFVASSREVIIAIVAVALLINGAAMIYPSERSKEMAKEAIPWVVIGSAIALGATTLAESLTSGF